MSSNARALLCTVWLDYRFRPYKGRLSNCSNVFHLCFHFPQRNDQSFVCVGCVPGVANQRSITSRCRFNSILFGRVIWSLPLNGGRSEHLCRNVQASSSAKKGGAPECATVEAVDPELSAIRFGPSFLLATRADRLATPIAAPEDPRIHCLRRCRRGGHTQARTAVRRWPDRSPS